MIRIGSTAPGHLKFVLYRNLGLLQKAFEKEGVEVEFLTFDGGSAASVALGSGELDFMYTGNNPALRLAASGADVKAIGLSAWVPQNEVLVLVPVELAGADAAGSRGQARRLPRRHRAPLDLQQGARQRRPQHRRRAELQPRHREFRPRAVPRRRRRAGRELGRRPEARRRRPARVLFDAGTEGNPEWSVPYIITANGAFLKKYPEVATRLLEQDIQLAKWVGRASRGDDRDLREGDRQLGGERARDLPRPRLLPEPRDHRRRR